MEASQDSEMELIPQNPLQVYAHSLFNPLQTETPEPEPREHVGAATPPSPPPVPRSEDVVYKQPTPRRVGRLSTEPPEIAGQQREARRPKSACASQRGKRCQSKYHPNFSHSGRYAVGCSFCTVCHPLEVLFNGWTERCCWPSHKASRQRIQKGLNLTEEQKELALERLEMLEAGEVLDPIKMPGETLFGLFSTQQLTPQSCESDECLRHPRRRRPAAVAPTQETLQASKPAAPPPKRRRLSGGSGVGKPPAVGELFACACYPHASTNGECFWVGKALSVGDGDRVKVHWRDELLRSDGTLSGVFRKGRTGGTLEPHHFRSVVARNLTLMSVQWDGKTAGVMDPHVYVETQRRARMFLRRLQEPEEEPEPAAAATPEAKENDQVVVPPPSLIPPPSPPTEMSPFADLLAPLEFEPVRPPTMHNRGGTEPSFIDVDAEDVCN